ncbi:MAG: formylglycine-generating enzyme family protein [Planctomycetia bacterium]|nr:formylglycine-generating enzyme family protein [Planctomycetia bacterium]
MLTALLTLAALAADPQPEQGELLKAFRAEFVAITPGRDGFPADLTMGGDAGPAEEKPPHRVTLARPFAMARYEVPQNLWQAVMGTNPSRWKGARNSAEMLSHDDAVAFCRKATELMRAAGLIERGQVIRLPTEAEWEYAARAGAPTRFSFGDDDRELADFGWFKGNAAGNDPPVGAKRPNAWKLYDVHGYLWEWCADAWHDSYEGAPADGSAWLAPGEIKKRVLRGGSWKDAADRCTSSARRGEPADTKDDAVGLRCVLATEKK